MIVFAGLFIGTAKAEIVYSGVREQPVSMVGLPTAIDLDGDGEIDLTFSYRWISTMDIPPSASSGNVRVSVGASTRILGTGNGASALPFEYTISAAPDAPYEWVSAGQAPYGLGIAGWSDSRSSGWSGWSGLGATVDPVIGVELSKADGKRYGWLRLRFGYGNFSAQVYDWAYETGSESPLTARMGSSGITATPPPLTSGLFFQDLTQSNYEAKLSGSKAVPPSANPTSIRAQIRISKNSFWCEMNVAGLAAGTVAVLETETETIQLRIGTFSDVQHSRSSHGTFATLSNTMADAVRSGKCHLVLKLPGGDIRGQIALKFPDVVSLPPIDESAGEYSLLIHLPPDSENGRPIPGGTAHGKLSVTNDRKVLLDVSLPIGTPLRWRGKLKDDNTVAVDILSNKTGVRTSLRGTLTLTKDENDYIVSGTLDWQKGLNPARRRYPRAIGLSLEVEGSRFRPHSQRHGTYQLSFSGSDLQEPVTIPVHAVPLPSLVTSEGDKQATPSFDLVVQEENPQGVTFDFNSLNGTFRGSFRHPLTETRIPFSGRLLSDVDEGEGSFIGRRRAGFVKLFGFSPGNSGELGWTVLGESTLSISETDPDVLVLSLKNLKSGFAPILTGTSARQTTAVIPSDLPLVIFAPFKCNLVPLTFGQPPQGVYEFRLVLQQRTEVTSEFPWSSMSEVRHVFQRPPGCRGIRVYHKGGVIELTAP